MIRVLIYGDIDPNVIDGSSIWLQSVTAAWAGVDQAQVTLLAKSRIDRGEVIAPLRNRSNLRIVDPVADGVTETSLSPFHVRRLIQDGTYGEFDIIVVRGLRVVTELTSPESEVEHLWVYLTDIPQLAEDVGPEAIQLLSQIANNSEVLLCQTEGLRSHFEDLAPSAIGKSWTLPPMIPPVGNSRGSGPIEGRTDLVYAGKFAPLWNTLRMCEIPRLLKERGVHSELRMIGDKIHRVADDPAFHHNMENALRKSPGVDWVGRRSRAETLDLMTSSDIGMAWRDAALSESLEISTKLLEYAAAGIPFILNRTPDHEALLGKDYPLFAETLGDVLDRIAAVASDPVAYEEARASLVPIASSFSIDRASRILQDITRRVTPSGQHQNLSPRRVLVMSHDFKFFDTLEEQLRLKPEFVFERDTWDGLFDHDPDTSSSLMSTADVVVCEWCGPNAVFASRNKKPEQQLVVRLHRFELYREHPRNLQIDNVDRVVVVNDHYRELVLERLGWPPEKVVVIPNWVDAAQLSRPKVGDVRFNLGMLGIAPPTRKRFDRALDVLSQLRRRDDRYSLFVKTKHAWEYPYMWSDPQERSASMDYIRLLGRSNELNRSVVFDRFGADVGGWLRKIGFVLSTSDDESFHLSPAEGMASGAIPVVFRWPGAETVYRERWIHASATEMAGFIDETVSLGHWDDLTTEVRKEALAIDLPHIVDAWCNLLIAPNESTSCTLMPAISFPPSNPA